VLLSQNVIRDVMDDLIDCYRYGSYMSAVSVSVPWQPQMYSRTLGVWWHWPLWWWVWRAWLWNKYVVVISCTICIFVLIWLRYNKIYAKHLLLVNVSPFCWYHRRCQLSFFFQVS